MIKAFDYLYNELKDEEKSQRNLLTTDNLGFYSLENRNSKNNLFGVDLDNRAVEITKLNLLLKGAEKIGNCLKSWIYIFKKEIL